MEGEREEKTPGFAIWHTRDGEKEEEKQTTSIKRCL